MVSARSFLGAGQMDGGKPNGLPAGRRYGSRTGLRQEC